MNWLGFGLDEWDGNLLECTPEVEAPYNSTRLDSYNSSVYIYCRGELRKARGRPGETGGRPFVVG